MDYSAGGAQGGGGAAYGGLGSYWKGTDGNVWVYGDQGVNNAGTWDNNTNDYWNSSGYTQISDPYASTGTLGASTTSNFSSGYGSDPTATKAIDTYLLDQQINSVNDGLGRIPNQRTIGEQNINNTYGSSVDQLTNDRSAAEGQYKLKVQDNNQDYTNIRGGVRRDAGNQYSALQRLLGAAGAGRSSAAQVLTPFAVGREAAQRFGQTQDTFGRNSRELDTNWSQTDQSYTSARDKLDKDKTNKLNELFGGIDNSQVDLNNQLVGLNLAKQQLQGGQLSDVQAAISPYQSRIQELLSGIDNYGKLAVSTPERVNFSAPSLQDYNYSRFATPTTNGQRSGVDDYTSPFVQLMNNKDKEKLSVQ